MISSVEIQNFQSHVHTEMEFHPGVNIIVGSSDSGKTAIIRALRWAVWNRPSGESFRSNWGGETCAVITTKGGIVVRSKDKIDRYILVLGGENDTEFKAFGTSVPEEISKFLNINEINLQQQLDSPFLLSESPGIVAQHFNKVAKLDKIDKSTQYIQGQIREVTSNIKYYEEEVIRFKTDLKKYEYLDKAEKDLEKLEKLDHRYVGMLRRRTKLETLISNIKDTKINIKQESKILAFESQINQLINTIDELAEQKTQRNKLSKLISSIKETKENLLQGGLIIIYESKVNNILTLCEEKDSVEKERKQLFKALQNLLNTRRYIKEAIEQKAELQEKFEKVFPLECPLCGKPK